MNLSEIVPVDGWLIEDIKYVCVVVRAQRVVLVDEWKIFNK